MKIFKTETGRQAIYQSYEKLVAKWGVTTEERDIQTSFGSTHVIMAGADSNPPLLMFHGAGDNSAFMWIANAQELAKDFRLIAIDTMGSSGKSVPNDRYKKEFDLVIWYGEILSALDIKKAYVTGVSYGAYHCQLIMICFPDQIEKMVGIAGYVYAQEYETRKFALLMNMMKIFLPLVFFPTKKTAVKAASKLCGPGFDELRNNHEITDHFWLLTRQYRTQAQFNHNRRPLTPEEIDSIRDKSLFLIGDQDTMISFSALEQAMEKYRLNLKIISDAGHGMNQTKSREIEAEIRGFLLGS